MGHVVVRSPRRSGFRCRKGPQGSSQVAHCAIVEAIRNHDPRAAESAMREHLVAVKDMLFGLR
ncbi:MAG: FCD domain-containing protein [Novosphingobium sp.]|nr:FCD domain-containing protein [Novosphingobium sp.]